ASTPLCFGGDAAPGCTLIHGPTQDFNLMLRGLKGRLTHVAGSLLCSVDAPRLIAVYPRQPGVSARFEQQEVEIAPHTLAWRVASRDGAFAITG
ncbi:HutD family protein, partial [Escherichia coli]|uniref:HutD family protein n=1 Tax=Escherichia coli TaxID=562 RepID=UPI0028DEBD42